MKEPNPLLTTASYVAIGLSVIALIGAAIKWAVAARRRFLRWIASEIRKVKI